MRCPSCQFGKLFGGIFKMLPRCPQCGLPYFRESGYYIGAMIVNYAVTMVIVLAVFLLSLLLPDFWGSSVNLKLLGLGAFTIAVSLAVTRHCRSFWLAMDFWLEPWTPDGKGRE
jgi:uncharacterized protein (DUF983 family)